ncbi:MAG: T9SS type A sorting domain-containing protein [Tannerella sp.]|nr:T9SS type A sorting domain-containing protein [Tannerella sp.]
MTAWLLIWLLPVVATGAFQHPDRRPAPENQVKITVTDNRIAVADAPSESVMEIYNVIGVKVREIQLHKSSGEYTLSLPKGYYIVRIRETVRKIVIR